MSSERVRARLHARSNAHVTSVELSAIRVGKWVILLFAVLGFAAYFLSGSAAVSLDGLYALIDFVGASIATRLLVAAARPPDRAHPYGQAALENLYVMFRSLVLIGIVLVAFTEGVYNIVRYVAWRQGEMPHFDIVALYSLVCFLLLLALAAWYRWNNHRVGMRSEVLAVEERVIWIDAAITAGIGFSLGAASLIPEGTVLTSADFNIKYIIDSVVLIVLAVLLVFNPVATVRSEFMRLAGRRADEDLEGSVTAALWDAISQLNLDESFDVIDAYCVRRGKYLDADVHLSFEGHASVDELDRVRDVAVTAVRERVGEGNTAVTFTRRAIHEQQLPTE